MAAPRKRRAVLDFSRSQSGDVATGDNAGGNISHGADANQVLDFLRSYVVSANQTRETAIKETTHELANVRMDFIIVTDAVRGVRESVNILVGEQERDRQDRGERQHQLDATLATLRTQAAYDRRLTSWLFALVLVSLAILLWLILERGAAVGFSRAVFDWVLPWRLRA